MGHAAPARAQVAAIAGWRITSGHLKNIAGSLRSLGLIDYPSEGSMGLTAAGIAVAPDPDISVTISEAVRGILNGPQRQVFDALLASGKSLTREKLCDKIGWNITSGHVKNVLGSLRSLEVVDYPTAGEVELVRWVTA